jgi:hypothetical protein
VNPLSLPVGIAIRVLGDLTAVATAARALVPAAQAVAEVDFRQAQDDLHVLAQSARRLPAIESELTRRMDEAEATVGRAVIAAEALVDGLDEVRASREALVGARGEAAALIAAAERAQTSLDRASDNVEAALARAEPLQGLAERVGRLSERLPGGRAGGA